MNSINSQQAEKNREDLTGGPAVEKIREIVNSSKSGFFCTRSSDGGMLDARPMSVQKIDEDGTIWFLSANDSRKNTELDADPRVELFFQASPHSDFLHLRGTATVSTDSRKIDELWDPIAKNWFTGGRSDPRITAIGVVPEDGYYWDTKHGYAVAAVKIMIGAVIGRTLDDSIEGVVRP